MPAWLVPLIPLCIWFLTQLPQGSYEPDSFTLVLETLQWLCHPWNKAQALTVRGKCDHGDLCLASPLSVAPPRLTPSSLAPRTFLTVFLITKLFPSSGPPLPLECFPHKYQYFRSLSTSLKYPILGSPSPITLILINSSSPSHPLSLLLWCV